MAYKKKQSDKPSKLPPVNKIAREPRTFVDRSVKGLPKLQRIVDDTLDGIPADVIAAVHRRADGRCEMCDRFAESGIPFELSHTIARGMGGTHGERSKFIHSAENIRFLCILCHRQLFHNETYVYNPGTDQEQSCKTCWLVSHCRETAVLRGILPVEI